jgi:hypothetical protein
MFDTFTQPGWRLSSFEKRKRGSQVSKCPFSPRGQEAHLGAIRQSVKILGVERQYLAIRTLGFYQGALKLQAHGFAEPAGHVASARETSQ